MENAPESGRATCCPRGTNADPIRLIQKLKLIFIQVFHLNEIILPVVIECFNTFGPDGLAMIVGRFCVF